MTFVAIGIALGVVAILFERWLTSRRRKRKRGGGAGASGVLHINEIQPDRNLEK